jgi:hypothetical protein
VVLEIGEVFFHDFDHTFLEFEILDLLFADCFLVVAEDGDLTVGFVVDFDLLLHGLVF